MGGELGKSAECGQVVESGGVYSDVNQCVKNIRRWTQFCDPLKKKNGVNSPEGISLKNNSIKDVYHNNSNNLEATFVKLSEKIHNFNTEFIDVWQQFAESYCFVTVKVKTSKKSYRY